MTKALTIPDGIRKSLAAYDKAYCRHQKETSLLRSVFEEQVIGAMQARTHEELRASLPAAQELFEWLARLEMSGMRYEIFSRWRDAEVPLASAAIPIEAAQGTFTLRGAVRMRFTPLGRLTYRYNAWLNDVHFHQGSTDITTELGLTHVVHPRLLVSLCECLREGQAWQAMDAWIQGHTTMLRSTDS